MWGLWSKHITKTLKRLCKFRLCFHRPLGREVPDDTPISPERWMERIQLTPNKFVGCRPRAQEGL